MMKSLTDIRFYKGTLRMFLHFKAFIIKAKILKNILGAVGEFGIKIR